MNLSQYTELTGMTVPTSQEAKVQAMIRRTRTQLETALGFSLKPKTSYTELGKVQFQGLVPNLGNLTENLQPADDEVNYFKLFTFNANDRYLHVDPFKNLNRVKLVIPLTDGDFVTIVDLDNAVAHYGRDGISKFIERYWEWFTWAWFSTFMVEWEIDYTAGMMLAVDADWIDCYPDDLLYLWADMVTYYSDSNYSLLGNVRSESVDGHSWARGNTNAFNTDSSPQNDPGNKATLARYAGPSGTVSRNVVR